jgi:hypothetical protein
VIECRKAPLIGSQVLRQPTGRVPVVTTAPEPAHPDPAGPQGGTGGVVASPVAGTAELAELDRLDAADRELAEKARAASTRAAYDRDWDRFRSWCEQRGLTAMPAEPRTLTPATSPTSRHPAPDPLAPRIRRRRSWTAL